MASAYIASTSASIEAAFSSAYASAICAEAADPLRFIAERLLESTGTWAGEEGEAFRPGDRTKVSRARDSMAVAKARGSGGGGGDRLSVDLEVDGAGGAVLRTEEFAANSCAA